MSINVKPNSSNALSHTARLLQSMSGLQVLRRYDRKDLGPDVLAGLVICLVLIPSALAYAELAGSGPVGGIYAAFAATVAYFLFASSRHMNVGPDGAVALLAGVAIMPLMLVGNLLQITIWGGVYIACGEFMDFATAFYHSVVNFTTLGYGDLVMSEKRRVLGSLEAANGVLMFGLATSVLFVILHDLIDLEWTRRLHKVGSPE